MKNFVWATTATAILLTAAPVKAADDEDLALLGFLGLAAVDGTTTTGEGAGKIEGTIIAASLMDKAAELIAEKTPNNVLIVEDSEKFSFGPYYAVKGRLSYLENEFGALGTCTSSGIGGLGGVNPQTIPAAIIGAAKSDQKVDGVEIKLGERMLINALAAKLQSKAFLSDSAIKYSGPGLSAEWQLLNQKAVQLSSGPCKDQDATKAALAVYGDVKSTLFAWNKDVGGSLFDQALALERFTNVDILRVRIEAAGGTLINTKNFLTQLGYPALRLSSGIVISYRLTSDDGKTIDGGVIICRTGSHTLGNITKPNGQLPVGDCKSVVVPRAAATQNSGS